MASQIAIPRSTSPAAQFSIYASPVSATLDASGDSLAFIFQHLTTGKTISSITVWCAAVGGTPPAYTVRLETVTPGTPPVPSGTLAATNTSGSITPVSANTALTATLTASYAPTDGEMLAIVINSASATGVNFATFRACCPTGGSWYLPAAIVNTTGSYVAQSQPPSVRITYSDGTYATTVLSATITNLTVDTGTTPDEVGNVIIPRVPMTVHGLGTFVRLQTTSADAELILYDDTSSQIAVITLDAQTQVMDNTSNQYRIHVSDGLDHALTVGATYRVAFKPTTLGDTNIGEIRFADTIDRKVFLGVQDQVNQVPMLDMYKTSRSDAGSWTDDDSRIVGCWPLIKYFTMSGMKTHPGMGGGLNG